MANRGARVALLGGMSGQASGGTSAPVELDTLGLISRGVVIRGMPGLDHAHLVPEAHREIGRGLRDGTLTFPHATLTGIERAPQALNELLEGRHVGSVLVEL
ncbi:hypothetical protein [Streptomyces sp. PT12]|uniref:hypothetical protein n=1 Tax=Streptomyces sp. PT12 TaxID=1510197 RepID=UPI000DE3FCD0|nr:hypothetical protein [Streptomyces sp. PT12]RBM13176.1 hypothetical protein DEH69_19515 [Streptomyces sp. PT12]